MSPANLRFFLDTEFIEDGDTIKLLSIGMVSEDDRALYWETPLARALVKEPHRADPWIRENVLPHLGQGMVGVASEIAEAVLVFCGEKPEIWAYYADYDWVAFCQLFGRMIDLPDGYPMYCRDLKQWADQLGVTLSQVIPQQTEHHALADARWNQSAYSHLASLLSPVPLTPEESGWRSMDSAPDDGTPFFAAIQVNSSIDGTYWQKHIIATTHDGECCTEGIADDYYRGWSWDSYEYWMPLPADPGQPQVDRLKELRHRKAVAEGIEGKDGDPLVHDCDHGDDYRTWCGFCTCRERHMAKSAPTSPILKKEGEGTLEVDRA